jgi:acetoin utilization protein AcuC
MTDGADTGYAPFDPSDVDPDDAVDAAVAAARAAVFPAHGLDPMAAR